MVVVVGGQSAAWAEGNDSKRGWRVLLRRISSNWTNCLINFPPRASLRTDESLKTTLSSKSKKNTADERFTHPSDNQADPD